METLLRIDVRWLDARYHGEEWPPSPFKLQQALIRVAADQGAISLHKALSLLTILESAPVIEYIAASRGRPVRLSVPNNDGRTKTMRTRRAWFLNRVPQLPDVRYLFRVNRVAGELAELLSLLHRVHTLGLGIDAAFVDAQVCDLDIVRCLPIRIEPISGAITITGRNGSKYGSELAHSQERGFELVPRLRVAEPGGSELVAQKMDRYIKRLQSLWQDVAYKPKRRARAIKPQVSIARPLDVGFESRRYRLADIDTSLHQADAMFATTNYQVAAFNVELVHDAFPEASFAAKLSAMMRHACKSLVAPYAKDEGMWSRFLEGPVCGHGTDPNQRIAFVPLPSCSGLHPDGRLRRALIAVPESVCDEFRDQVRELMFRMQGGIELKREPDDQFPNTSDRRFAFLIPAESDDHTFRVCIESSRTWCSVTPVIFHGYDRNRSGRISRSKIERMLGNALRQVGLEMLLAEYEVSQVCFSQGIPLAGRFFRPENLSGPNRAICHLKLTFKREVFGPILLGLGRHRGLGLFVAAR